MIYFRKIYIEYLYLYICKNIINVYYFIYISYFYVQFISSCLVETVVVHISSILFFLNSIID